MVILKITLALFFIEKAYPFWDFFSKTKVLRTMFVAKLLYISLNKGKRRRSRPNESGRSFDQAGTLSLRGPKKIYTARRAAPSLMGWDGMDGTEDQMGPSIFFILCWYIVHVYMYQYTFSKFFTKIFMGLKIWSQVGELDSDFQNHDFNMIF